MKLKRVKNIEDNQSYTSTQISAYRRPVVGYMVILLQANHCLRLAERQGDCPIWDILDTMDENSLSRYFSLTWCCRPFLGENNHLIWSLQILKSLPVQTQNIWPVRWTIMLCLLTTTTTTTIKKIGVRSVCLHQNGWNWHTTTSLNLQAIYFRHLSLLVIIKTLDFAAVVLLNQTPF